MKKAKEKPATKEYKIEEKKDLFKSIDLKNVKINNNNPIIPGSSLSKNPTELL